MALYYSMGEVLDQVDQAGTGANRLNTLIAVHAAPPRASGRMQDVFQLTSHPKLLDLTRKESGQALQNLMTEAPLYAISLELAMDHSLTQRHKNKNIDHALHRAFGHDPLPGNADAPWNTAGGEGSLAHPVLGHMDKGRLCEIYIAFLNALPPGERSVSFGTDVIGKHPERFMTLFEGYVTPQESRVKASILLAFGIRLDHDPGKPLESYVSAGRKKASKMRITDPLEMLWAWLEAENSQMRHCRDLDRALRLNGLPRRPNWIKYDVFSLLEMEAVKQYLAEQYVRADPAQHCLADAPAISRAVRANAEGRVNDILQQLLAESLNAESGYTGSALKFADEASVRVRDTSRMVAAAK